MALIIDPDQYVQGTEIDINKGTLDITLNLAGNLSEDGGTGQSVYSFLKEEWLNEVNDVHKYTFPMLAITPEQFEIGNNGSFFSDWTWTDNATRKLIRTAGWREYDNTGAVLREDVGVITLGNIDSTSKTVGDKAYYAFTGDAARTEFTYAGPVNEAVQIFGDAANGNFDNRGVVLSNYIRQEGKTVGISTTTDIGVAALTYKVERFPLTEGADLKITTLDVGIDADSNDIADVVPYDTMSIEYFATPQASAAGGTVHVRIDGGSGNATAEQIYEFVQWQLRLDADIDSGAGNVNGYLAEELLEFVGDTLKTKRQSNGDGVDIINFDSNDTNRLVFVDDAGVEQQFPFVSAGNIQFNTNIVNDTAAKYWMFFDNAGGNLINTDLAIVVENDASTPITGLVTGASVIPWDFDYDGNVQGGRTAATDATITIRAIGLNTAQFVEAKFTISRNVGQNFPLTASLERNYLNP